jgi:hypothetical protein
MAHTAARSVIQIALILKKAKTTIFNNITPWRKREIWVSPYDRAA